MLLEESICDLRRFPRVDPGSHVRVSEQRRRGRPTPSVQIVRDGGEESIRAGAGQGSAGRVAGGDAVRSETLLDVGDERVVQHADGDLVGRPLVLEMTQDANHLVGLVARAVRHREHLVVDRDLDVPPDLRAYAAQCVELVRPLGRRVDQGLHGIVQRRQQLRDDQGKLRDSDEPQRARAPKVPARESVPTGGLAILTAQSFERLAVERSDGREREPPRAVIEGAVSRCHAARDVLKGQA